MTDSDVLLLALWPGEYTSWDHSSTMSANSGKCYKTDIIVGRLPKISFYKKNHQKIPTKNQVLTLVTIEVVWRRNTGSNNYKDNARSRLMLHSLWQKSKLKMKTKKEKKVSYLWERSTETEEVERRTGMENIECSHFLLKKCETNKRTRNKSLKSEEKK